MTASYVRERDNFLVFGAPLIGDDEVEELIATVKSGWLGTGPRVKQFEREMADYTGAKHAVAVNSCTAALHLSLIAAGVGPGDQVITTAMTFCATVNAIIHSGATPVLADIDPATGNIDTTHVASLVNRKTRAIVPVHFAGRLCNMQDLGELANHYNLQVIEDCAHAIETRQGPKHAGTFGDFGCFSFYVTKNVVTGEGGMITTDSDEAADRLRVLSLHGMSKDAYKRFGNEGFKHYEVVEPGFKYNMMDVQAALGIHQLARVEQTHARREQIWNFYQQHLPELGLVTPPTEQADKVHAYHLYTTRINQDQHGISRDQFLDGMTRQGIGLGVHYLSIPAHRYYRDTFGWALQDYPHAVALGSETVSLPISAALSDQDLEDVITAARRVLNR